MDKLLEDHLLTRQYIITSAKLPKSLLIYYICDDIIILTTSKKTIY